MRQVLLSIGILFVCSASVADLWVAFRPDLRTVSRLEVSKAHAQILSVMRPGDVIVHSPLLGVDELKGLEDLRASPMLPTERLFKTRRIILLDRTDVSMFGFPSSPASLWVGENLSVAVFEPDGDVAAILFDLKDSIRPSTMRVESLSGDVLARCDRARPEGGYLCPGQDSWHYIAKRTLRVGSEDRMCVWAHPKANAAIVFAVPAMPAPTTGRELHVRLSAGFTDDAVTTTPDGSLSRIEIRQGTEAKGTLSVANRIGWFTHETRIDPDAPLELRITSPRDGRRHLCLDAEIVDAPVGGKP